MFVFFFFNHEQDPVNFKNQSSYWVCGQLPMSSNSGLPCWISPLPGSDWMALRKFILEERKFSLLLILLYGILSSGQFIIPTLTLVINMNFPLKLFKLNQSNKEINQPRNETSHNYRMNLRG